jgi:hypothetical protein
LFYPTGWLALLYENNHDVFFKGRETLSGHNKVHLINMKGLTHKTGLCPPPPPIPPIAAKLFLLARLMILHIAKIPRKILVWDEIPGKYYRLQLLSFSFTIQ